jgi:hypothetical protein
MSSDRERNGGLQQVRIEPIIGEMHLIRAFLIGLVLASVDARAVEPATQPTILDCSDAWPIAVWVQSPAIAARYKAIGINLYVGLWNGPRPEQLEALEKVGMQVICAQNAEALKPRWRSTAVGFLQNDEPDNAQSLGRGKGYGPPVPPERVIERYRAMKAADARPVMLNLGQGVAWDGWVGRGVRTNKPEDYREYVKGGDIVSFDIYPAVHENAKVAGKLEYVGRGVERLMNCTDPRTQRVWTCIECTHVGNAKVKPTPQQVKAEVWMAIIHGARGITYFAHQFQPTFIEAGLLADAEMAEAVKKINAEIQELAPVLNSAPPEPRAEVTVDGGAPADVALMTRRYKDSIYVFAVGMTARTVTAHLRLNGATGEVEVLGEQRRLQASTGGWADEYKAYQVHLYKLPAS